MVNFLMVVFAASTGKFVCVIIETVSLVDGCPEILPDQLQAVAQSVEQQRRSVQQHPVLTCIRRHESDRAGGYTAQNRRSSASGAYQFIDSTWRTAAARAGHPGYSRAMYAPWYVQDAVALYTSNHGGRSHWNGSGC